MGYGIGYRKEPAIMRRVKPTLGSVYRLSDGSWRAAITVGYDGRGKRVRRVRYGATRSEAIQKRNELLASLESELPSTMTVEAWTARWLAGDAAARLRPRVLLGARSIVRNYINPTLGAYRLSELGAEEVRELHGAARRAGVSDRTVQIIHSTLSTCMKAARREGLIEMNPCDRVDRPRAVSARRGSLTAHEARQVISHAFETEDPLDGLWLTYLLMGIRKGEGLGFEWERLDLDRGIVDLSWAQQSVPWRHGPRCGCPEGRPRNWCATREHDIAPGFEIRPIYGATVLTRPKTASSVRALPLPEVLRQFYLSIRTEGATGLVWTREDGRPLVGAHVSRAWKEACTAAGVRPLVMHTTRHTTASLLMEAGVSPEVIREILGHSDLVSTRGYLHVSQAMAADGLGRLAGLLALPALQDAGNVHEIGQGSA